MTAAEKNDDEEDEAEDEEKEDDIEAELAKELKDMQQSRESKKEQFKPVDLDCECVVFFRTRKPVEPVEFVNRICKDAKDNGVSKTRFTQRLTPISRTETATLEGLKRLAKEVLKEHFHKESGQEPLKFAIRPQLRNHNTLSRDDIIQTVAECVGNDHGHKVDLKNYDKLILIEAFKSSIGMSVVDNQFEPLERFNLEQIHEKRIQKEADK